MPDEMRTAAEALKSRARWIGLPASADAPKNGTALFRKKFVLPSLPESTRVLLTASARGLFELWCGAERKSVRIGSDELKPGYVHFGKRAPYLTYDVSGIVGAGENTLFAAVAGGWFSWYSGSDPHALAFRAALVLSDGENSETVLLTDGGWECSFGGAVRFSHIHHGEVVDARLPSFSELSSGEAEGDIPWMSAEEKDGIAAELLPFIGPPVTVHRELARAAGIITVYTSAYDDGSDFGSADVVSVSLPYRLKKGETAVFDFGQNLAGWQKVTLRGERGTKVRFRFAEALNDSGSRSRGCDGAAHTLYRENLRGARAECEYTLRGEKDGEEYRPTFTYYGFRYLDVVSDAEVELVSLIAEPVFSDYRETGSFTCSSAEVNRLFENALWGQRSNYLSVPTDCPQRDERLGWTGDAQVFCRAGAYNGNILGFMRKWLADMSDSQGDEGQIPNSVPNMRPKYGCAAWADAAVIVPYTMYLMYGDREFLEECYPMMRRYMGYLGRRGYIAEDPGFGDWLAYEETDAGYLNVCYFAGCASMAAEAAKALGEKEDEKVFWEMYRGAKEYFSSRYTDGRGWLKEDGQGTVTPGTVTPGTVSQTAYLLASRFGLLEKENEKKLSAALEKKLRENSYRLSTGFVGTSMLLTECSRLGLDKEAYALLTQTAEPSWLFTVRAGATTMWERWNSYTPERGFGDAEMNSFNHYAYGAVAEWMYRFAAGIEADIDAPGFERVILTPRPDLRSGEEIASGMGGEKITFARAELKTKYGTIKSGWRFESDGAEIVFDFSVPHGCRALLRLPELSGYEPAGPLPTDQSGELGEGEYSVRLKKS